MAEDLSKKLSRPANEKTWKKAAHVRNKLHTLADCRLQNAKQSLRPVSENLSINRPYIPNPHIHNISGGFSSREIDGDSACHSSVRKENIYSGDISTKRNPSNTCSNSREYIAEETRNNSLLSHFAATNSCNIQNTSSDDSLVDLTNCPPLHHLPNVKEVEVKAVPGHGDPKNPEGVKRNRRGYSSFLPTDNIDLGRFYEYIKQHDFVETDNLREY